MFCSEMEFAGYLKACVKRVDMIWCYYEAVWISNITPQDTHEQNTYVFSLTMFCFVFSLLIFLLHRRVVSEEIPPPCLLSSPLNISLYYMLSLLFLLLSLHPSHPVLFLSHFFTGSGLLKRLLLTMLSLAVIPVCHGLESVFGWETKHLYQID